MKTAVLTRFDSSDQGTFGILVCDNFRVYTAELPWRDNERSKSCIPEGLYKVSWIKSPRFGFTYGIQEVLGRSEILLHKGNFVGNVDLSMRSDSHGCILPARKLGFLDGQKAGLMSLIALQDLIRFFNREDFMLEIRNGYQQSGPGTPV